jgi:Fic family protein
LQKEKIISDSSISVLNRYICVVKWELNIEDVYKVQENYARVFEKKRRLDSHRPLSAGILENLKEGISLEWTYNSNSIEGNSLTLQETRVVLRDGMTVGGKSLREHFETANHDNAIELLETLVCPTYTLNTRDILNVHEIILSNILKEFAGRYRMGGVRIQGANFTVPNALKVYDLMEELVAWTNENPLGLNPIALATVFHHRFVYIHPFQDGNGRTVRLIMNLILMKEGYPPAIILKADRNKYYTALNTANNGNYQKLMLLMAQAAERSLNIYLNAMPTTSYDEDYDSISSIVEDPAIPYGQEYVSLLARTGKISAHKEGRNWVTNKKAVLDYIRRKDS